MQNRKAVEIDQQNNTENIIPTFVILSAGHRSDLFGKESPDSKGQHTG